MPSPAVDEPTAALLRQDFALPRERLTEAELLDWLTERVAELLRLRPEYFMSLCYTLDLDQTAVAAALAPSPSGTPPPRRLAELLYARQCTRARTKQAYRPPTLTDEDAW